MEKKGKPVAVLISPEQFESIQHDEERLWQAVDQIRARNAESDPDEVLRDVTSVVDEVRQERSDSLG